MTIWENINRFSLIIQRVRKSPASFKQISEYLEAESELQESNFYVADRTFKRVIKDIYKIYKIDIKYNFSTKVYSILESDETDLNNRMLEAFDTFNALNRTEGISKYIHFEERRPQGTEYFQAILQAIQQTVLIKFSYHKYWHNKPENRLLMPYALKEFKGRWYILGKDQKDDRIKTFGLDRIRNLESKTKKYKYPKDLNVAELYKNCFGIINPIEGQPEKISLSFDVEQGKYVKSFPLHISQEIIIDNEQELRINLFVLITHDLIMEILSYGQRVKVISPESLQQQLIENYKTALAYYY